MKRKKQNKSSVADKTDEAAGPTTTITTSAPPSQVVDVSASATPLTSTAALLTYSFVLEETDAHPDNFTLH